MQELGEAQRLLEKIKTSEERTFQYLVFYAVGRVFVRENRYAVSGLTCAPAMDSQLSLKPFLSLLGVQVRSRSAAVFRFSADG